MAIIKFVNQRPSLEEIIEYAQREGKLFAVEGKDCSVGHIVEEMKFTKQLYQKEGGREFIHLIQSFSPKDNVTPEKVHELGMKLAEYFKGFEVMVATHTDKNHLHSHLIINSVNFENGKKFHQSREQMQMVKDYSNKICMEAGLEVITRKSMVKDINLNEYKVRQKGESWKKKLIDDIEMVMKSSNKKYEFISKMNELGYKVTWKKERKYITYTTPEGKKCRDFRLHDEKFLKENMENYFLEKQKTISNYKERRAILIRGFRSSRGFPPMKANKYKGELSKQAKKEYAIKKANASSIDWEAEME